MRIEQRRMKSRLISNIASGHSYVWSALAFVAVFSQSALAQVSYFEQQWGLRNAGQVACSMDGQCTRGTMGADIKAALAWEKVTDCSSVIVAVLDSGVDTTHPDLVANLLPGVNFTVTPATLDPSDDNLHGTHVTGTIAASGRAARGICLKAKVLPVKIGTAEGRMTDADIIEGIQYASAKGARVLNASFGGPGNSNAIKSAIQKASNTLIVAAAGNGRPTPVKGIGKDGKEVRGVMMLGFSIDESPLYPAAYDLPNLIAVAATDNQDRLGLFSNFGPKAVHIAAPGVGIMSTLPMQATAEMRGANIPARYGILDGTSMAAPHVSGAAAMLLAKSPRMTPALVKSKLISSSDAVPAFKGKTVGGRLNLARLIQ